MAKILVHREGTQMGPYDLEEVRQLVYAGMLRETDLAWLQGTPAWVSLSTLLAAPASFAQPAALPATSLAYAPQAVGTSGLAVASLVLGILSLLGCLFLGAVPAVICGHLALSTIRNSRGYIKGEGLALAGLITGYSAIIITVFVVLAFLVFPVFLSLVAAVASH